MALIRYVKVTHRHGSCNKEALDTAVSPDPVWLGAGQAGGTEPGE